MGEYINSTSIPFYGGFHKWGYPLFSSILDSDFPLETLNCLGYPHFELETRIIITQHLQLRYSRVCTIPHFRLSFTATRTPDIDAIHQRRSQEGKQLPGPRRAGRCHFGASDVSPCRSKALGSPFWTIGKSWENHGEIMEKYMKYIYFLMEVY